MTVGMPLESWNQHCIHAKVTEYPAGAGARRLVSNALQDVTRQT